MLHIVIPAAGEGRRFADAGYDKPKPLVDVCGLPMIQRVVENLMPLDEFRVTVLSQIPLDFDTGDLSYVDVRVVGPTGGAVETILHADIESGPLLMANCDQLTSLDIDAFVASPGDGALATFRSAKPHHSYVITDEGGWVTDIAEKEVISRQAVAGVYYFGDGSAFAEAGRDVINRNFKVRGEFYVSTVIGEMVQAGAKLGTMDTDVAILGTPEELQLFLSAARVAAAL